MGSQAERARGKVVDGGPGLGKAPAGGEGEVVVGRAGSLTFACR